MSSTFSPDQLERYARHIVMREIGGPGQKRLRGARVLVIGAGGLGAPALAYLAAAGVGRIGIVDDDIVSLSNLQRQVIHVTSNIGMPKVESARDVIRELNPHVIVDTHKTRLTEANAFDLIKPYRLVIDGSDNFATRYLVNRICAERNTTLVSAALSPWEGQLSVFKPWEGGPCYQCVFPEQPADGLVEPCSSAGVLGPLAGVMGSMIAAETIKDITHAGRSMKDRMIVYNALEGETRTFSVERNPDCPVCSGKN